MKPNTQFELNVQDIDTIEAALRSQLGKAAPAEQHRINNLLGKLHHQKNWPRPKDKPYISG